jgi:hypothetical protein
MAIARWIARIVGLLIFGLVLLFSIGEGFDPNPMKLAGMELAMSASFIVAMIGMVVLWNWEGIGSLWLLAVCWRSTDWTLPPRAGFPVDGFFRSVSCPVSWLLFAGLFTNGRQRGQTRQQPDGFPFRL